MLRPRELRVRSAPHGSAELWHPAPRQQRGGTWCLGGHLHDKPCPPESSSNHRHSVRTNTEPGLLSEDPLQPSLCFHPEFPSLYLAADSALAAGHDGSRAAGQDPAMAAALASYPCGMRQRGAMSCPGAAVWAQVGAGQGSAELHRDSSTAALRLPAAAGEELGWQAALLLCCFLLK